MIGEREEGFTLVELLVAITVFAVLAVMAYGGLSSVLHTKHAIDAQSKRLQSLQQTMLFLGRDLSQIVPRGIRDEYGQSQPALVAQTNIQSGLEFTHDGWSNPASQPRSTLQRVSYVIEDNQLVRYSWQVLDRAPDSKPYRFPMLDQVLSMKTRFMDAKGNWQEQWPLPTDSTAQGSVATVSNSLPLAVEITLELKDIGIIRRLFTIDAQGVAPAVTTTATGSTK